MVGRFRRAIFRGMGGGVAATAMLFALAVPAGASSGPEPAAAVAPFAASTVEVHDSRTLAVVPHAWSHLRRTPLGLLTIDHLTGVPAGREVTLHAIIFNHPEACAGNGIPGLSPCGAADMTPGGPAGFFDLTGPTVTATPSGRATLTAWLSDQALTNPGGALVILSFNIEGCGTGKPCANQLAVHLPAGTAVPT
jgi:hypothetical protein